MECSPEPDFSARTRALCCLCEVEENELVAVNDEQLWVSCLDCHCMVRCTMLDRHC